MRGPNIFAGYWRDAEATSRALTTDGWLRTGDVAVADDDGYLYLVDRAKDLIIVSGFNVYPGEVEEVIAEYPGVDDVAVVGSPHPSTGEAVKAFVVTAPGSSHEEEAIIEHCRRSLARYKCPSKVMFVDELPKGWGGKVLRRASPLSRTASCARRAGGVVEVATRNPANSMLTPIVSVTANAVDVAETSVERAARSEHERAQGDEHVADGETSRMRGDTPTPSAFSTRDDPPRGQHRARDHDDRGSPRADGGEHAGQRAEHVPPRGELGAGHRLEERGRGHHAGREQGGCRDRDPRRGHPCADSPGGTPCRGRDRGRSRSRRRGRRPETSGPTNPPRTPTTVRLTRS